VVFLQASVGEWPWSSIGLGLAFLVAVVGATGLGWYVMRADRLNRQHEIDEPAEHTTLHNEAH
jgi:hypothetical protein